MSESEPVATALNEAPVDAQEVMRKYDKESDYRILKGFRGKIIAVIAIVFSLFQVYTALFGVLDAMMQRSIHLAFGFCLIFLLYPASKKWPKDRIHPIDIFLSVIGAAAPLYISMQWTYVLSQRAGMPTTLDIVVGIIGILLVLEATRRLVGLPMVVIALVFVAYAFAGPYLPGKFAHRGVDVPSLVEHLFYTTEGIFGTPIGVSSTFIFLFILFGAFLDRTGLEQFFIDISNAIAGWASGGPAKVAVIASALEGTVSGSSVGNVVGSGSFTIPMMKKLGYSPEFAAAVEATASTGGQIMPPIMGAAAFLMAEFTNIPYGRIALGAIIPALLYFFAVFAQVHFEAKKLGLKGMKREELPKTKDLILHKGYLMIPLLAIIFLLTSGATPMKAAMWAIIISVAIALLTSIVQMIRKQKPDFTVKDIFDALEQGARGALGVIAACACAGIITGVVTKTGLGLKLGEILVGAAHGNLLLTMFFTMITSLILGMGVPTTANYVITSTIAAPAIIMVLNHTAGYPFPPNSEAVILSANMFAFYFGVLADITPPVALAAFAGSAIAKSNPMKTGLQATKLGIAAFIIPFIFVLNPEMLLFGVAERPFTMVWMIISSIIGIVGLATGVEGYFLTKMKWYERILAIAGGIGLVDPGLATDLIGGILLVIAVVIQVSRKRNERALEGAGKNPAR
ncbi:MAG TPA: TRAP transporter permease [Spirochaetales bacterium]|nr:TRAP transporter permease [Spirochaetales bacterium]